MTVKLTSHDKLALEAPSASANDSDSKVNANDARMLSAWRQWLGALATDADAAHAAAMAYKELDESAREVWLEALAGDALAINVPKIAVYAPLLAVESDPARRRRIQVALDTVEAAPSSEPSTAPRMKVQALYGRSGPTHAGSGLQGAGLHVAAVIMPLYLDFVQVFACGYTPGSRFEWVRHDPIVLSQHAPRAGSELGCAVMEQQPLKAVIDELAVTVLAHRRNGLDLPSALEVLSELFAPFLDDGVAEGA